MLESEDLDARADLFTHYLYDFVLVTSPTHTPSFFICKVAG
jgi:hypothetical protein